MRLRPFTLPLLLGLGLSPLGCFLEAQTRDDTCLPPLPSLPAPGGLLAGKGERGDSLGGLSGAYVSPEGELCRRDWLLPEVAVRQQMAAGPATKPGKAFLLSAVVPGTGQWFLGQRRWPVYLALETWAWVQFLDWRRQGHNLQADYRDLAWYVARRVSTGPRTDAGWEYYEALTRFPSSGAFDSDPMTPGVQPEEDPDTFNGSIWALAQEIFLPEDPGDPAADEDPEPLQKAFEYYASRAYPLELAWDWGPNSLHQEEYTTLIRESDEALRNSTTMIGVILANHLLSAVDALISGRLRMASQAEASLNLSVQPGPLGHRAVVLQLRLPDPISHVP